jgi:hypothetical protein
MPFFVARVVWPSTDDPAQKVAILQVGNPYDHGIDLISVVVTYSG